MQRELIPRRQSQQKCSPLRTQTCARPVRAVCLLQRVASKAIVPLSRKGMQCCGRCDVKKGLRNGIGPRGDYLFASLLCHHIGRKVVPSIGLLPGPVSQEEADEWFANWTDLTNDQFLEAMYKVNSSFMTLMQQVWEFGASEDASWRLRFGGKCMYIADLVYPACLVHLLYLAYMVYAVYIYIYIHSTCRFGLGVSGFGCACTTASYGATT